MQWHWAEDICVVIIGRANVPVSRAAAKRVRMSFGCLVAELA
ncbi:MAG: hypothetical protein R6U56_03070 [Opitutales bacterium]